MNQWQIAPSDLIIVHDDLDHALGWINVKKGASAKCVSLKFINSGHNGVRSVISSLNTPDFSSVRIGIGRPDSKDPVSVAHFVLQEFKPLELEFLYESVFPKAQTLLKEIMLKKSASF